MTLVKGSRLGSYEIVESIGAGGMGEVFRARDPELGRDIAIKVLSPAHANERTFSRSASYCMRCPPGRGRFKAPPASF